MSFTLNNISPIDGRYAGAVSELRDYFSESALIKYRVMVEVEWFIYLSNKIKPKELQVWTPAQIKRLKSLYVDFDNVDAERVKTIEQTTNHDVKAVEYFIKEKLTGSEFESHLEFFHFACTSEDINNLAYGLMIKDAYKLVVQPLLTGVAELIYQSALKYKSVPMMSHTHGQPATPTTLGKEFVNFVDRIEREMEWLDHVSVCGKINGAVGNYNAHRVAYPDVDWLKMGADFVNGLGLECNLYTTQIEPHDYLARGFDSLKRINNILVDFNRDVWAYISIGYFKQKVKKGEIGSSTMPHKVNPIDFENSEGNLGIANALLEHMSGKLTISRMQRDLTDSTVLRNVGVAIAHCVIAYKACIKGIHKLEINNDTIEADLDSNWELLAEPIQTVMRKHGTEGAYEKLKELTRGKGVDKKKMEKFIENLDLPVREKKALLKLSPDKYIGLAVELVDNYKPRFL